MITIARCAGGAPLLTPFVPASSPGGVVCTWTMAPDAPVPWAGFRALVAATRGAVGDARVDRALAAEAGFLHLVFRGLPAPASHVASRQGGLAQRGRPNVVARSRPVRAAFTRVLVSLLEGREVTLVVPEADDADLESLAALRPLLGALRGRANVRVVLGWDETRAPGEGLASLVRARRQREVARYEALAVTCVVAAERGEHPRPVPAVDRNDAALEARAYAALAAQTAGWEPLARQAMRASFDAFGFDAAYRFAEALAYAPCSAEERREIHLTAAMACQNLDPLPVRSGWAAATLDTHFAGALEGESDPLAKAHVLYRQTLLRVRAHDDVAGAIACADEAIALAAAARTHRPDAPYFEGWAHNARAYALARDGRTDAAAEACEAALGCLSTQGLGAALCETDVALARALVGNNRARVAGFAGDAQGLPRWRAEVDAHLATLPVDERPGPLWLTPPEDTRDLGASLRYHAGVLTHAEATFEPEVEAAAAHAVALARFRLGDAAAARACFSTALRIWRRLDAFPEDIATEELNCAVASFRMADLPAAEEGFETLRVAPLFAVPAAQAELLGALAMIAAARGDAPDARARARRAIDEAEATEDLEVLVRVLRAAGEVELSLGDRSAAAALFERARERIAAAESVPAEDELGILVGLLEAGSGDAHTVARALEVAPHALGDANAWWDLPRLVRQAEARGATEIALRQVRAASAQRVA